MPTLTVAGSILSADFHETAFLAQNLKHEHPSIEVIVHELVPSEWIAHREQTTRELGGHALLHSGDVLVTHSLFGYIGGLQAFLRWLAEHLDTVLVRSLSSSHYAAVARRRWNTYMEESKHKFCSLVFESEELAACKAKQAQAQAAEDDEEVQPEPCELVVELYDDLCPRAVDNFLGMCKSAALDGSLVHRVVKDGWIQAGDVVDGSGAHSESTFGGSFEDESFTLPHDRIGVLSMCNDGPHTNGSQFFITLRELPYFDQKFEAFGRVIKGIENLELLGQVATKNERPVHDVRIARASEQSPEAPEAAGNSRRARRRAKPTQA